MINKIPVIDCRQVRVHSMAREKPEDGEIIAYYFQPFNEWFIGTHFAISKIVFGKNGMAGYPEIPYWIRLPKFYDDASCLEINVEDQNK